jgi:hypothetical protein
VGLVGNHRRFEDGPHWLAREGCRASEANRNYESSMNGLEAGDLRDLLFRSH